MNNNKLNSDMSGIMLSKEGEDRRSYKWHYASHGRLVWFCDICGFRFESFPYLESHYRNKHGEDYESYSPWIDGKLDVNHNPPLAPKSEFQNDLKAVAAKIEATKLRTAEAELNAANNNSAANNNNN